MPLSPSLPQPASTAGRYVPVHLRPAVLLGVAKILVPTIAVIWAMGPCGERRFTQCVQCRIVRVQHSYLGYPWQTFVENSHTHWYHQQAPNHEHFWVGVMTPYSIQNGFGRNIGAASNLGNWPAACLTPEQQSEVYEHIGDLAAADKVFADLGSCQNANRPEAGTIARSLKRWAEEDKFQTPWSAWERQLQAELGDVTH